MINREEYKKLEKEIHEVCEGMSYDEMLRKFRIFKNEISKRERLEDELWIPLKFEHLGEVYDFSDTHVVAKLHDGWSIKNIRSNKIITKRGSNGSYGECYWKIMKNGKSTCIQSTWLNVDVSMRDYLDKVIYKLY